MQGFGSTRTLRTLNVAAVGLALAACTAAALQVTLNLSGLATGPSTLVAGIAWALCMRSRATLGKTTIRRGWLWSIPIAMANAGVSCAIFLSMENGPFLAGLIFGPTFGVIVWAPALLMTLLCFGVPIASSQRAAAKGLAGEERGEAIVGAVCSVLAAFGLIVASGIHVGLPLAGNGDLLGKQLALAAGALGLACGGAATVLALRREALRRRFVKRVSAGEVAGFRVDDTEEGRVLVRVTELGSGYRVSNFTEELYSLDQQGHATQALSARSDG